jgi:type IV pilus assembly protein PilY1
MNRQGIFTGLLAAAGLAASFTVQAQSAISEDFTSTTTTNSWYSFFDACLTAGTMSGSQPSGGTGGQIPGCTAISSTYGENLVGGQNGVAGSGQTLPDPVGSGALRFTNGSPGGYNQHGAIISAAPFPTGQGVAITFKTVTYRGDSGGTGGDGADGISFFLMDASQTPNIGSFGGSLAYTCSNANPPYTGMVGGYLGLGIDEFGNFLNGATLMPGYTGSNTATGDNTVLGYGYKPNRIGMRGAGNIAWSWLNANYPTYYPSSMSSAQQQAAVQATCRNGVVWNSTSGGPVTSGGNPIALYDYAPIPNAYVELPSTVKIANESAMSRPAATPIFYALKITQDGLLSLSYSINGGAYQSVINKQNITTANGPLPANFLFGFAGSTGGDTNIHEILCFKAQPATSASTSAGASERQSAKLETGAQAYFAFYNPNDNWTGRVTASNLSFDAFNNVIIATIPNWDASCNLTGVPTGSTCATTLAVGPVAAQAPTSRVILSYSGTAGIPFEWSNLTAAQQTTLDLGDTAATPCNSTTAYATNERLNFLRGDRSCEISITGTGLFRRRTSVLADIIDSSPSWVGPPIATYSSVWSDRIVSTDPLPENGSSAQTYPAFQNAQVQRENVVYVGANDGLLHGFRSGYYDANSNFYSATNDGQEVLAYMPGAVVQTIHSTTANLDYSNSQYGHNFFVDATPATGDLFFNGVWHTWVVGGLGAGGASLFALDVTTPANPSTGVAGNFTEANAASLVVGEWTSATISCANVAGCNTSMGNTYGTPVIRRLHDGKWAVIFGNGYGSTSGDAGIYVMTISATGVKTFYYLSTHTGSAASPNGIAYPSPVDLDGDHITDYVYAGDLQGNLWRFDLTSATEANWAVTAGPVFKTPAGQPITTAIVAASGSPSVGMQQQLMLLFGTGQKIPLTNTTPATYAAATQSLYGVWDWNMSAWNTLSPNTQYASMAGSATGLSGNYTEQEGNLVAQVVTINTTTQDRDIASNASICWPSLSGCTGAAARFGWYLNLPGVQEQIIYNPELVSQALTVNSIVPAPNAPTSCAALTDNGFTYVLNAMTGGAFNEVFLPPSEAANPTVSGNAAYTDPNAIGLLTMATGSSFVTSNNAGTRFLVFETNQANNSTVTGGTVGLNLPPNTSGRRISWVQRR